MQTLLIPIILVAFLAALGHSATPRAERLPWRRWIPLGLVRNTVLGTRRLVALYERGPVATYQRTQSHRGTAPEPAAGRADSPAGGPVDAVEGLRRRMPEATPAQATP